MTVPQAAQWSQTVALLLRFVLITTGSLTVVLQFTVYAPLTKWVRTQRSIGTYVTYARERATRTRVAGASCARILFRHFN